MYSLTMYCFRNYLPCVVQAKVLMKCICYFSVICWHSDLKGPCPIVTLDKQFNSRTYTRCTRVFESTLLFLISNFRRVLNVVFFILGDSPASEFYVPAFRNTLSVPSYCILVPVILPAYTTYEDRTDRVFRNVGT